MGKTYIDRPKYILTIILLVFLMLVAILVVSLIIVKKNATEAMEAEKLEQLIAANISKQLISNWTEMDNSRNITISNIIDPNSGSLQSNDSDESVGQLKDPCSSNVNYNYTLNDGVKPIRYDISFTVKTDTTNYSGKLSIFIEIERETKLIAFNVGNDIDVNKCHLLSNASEEIKTSRRPIDRIQQYYVIETSECLPNGVYEIYIEFKAKYGNNKGIYRNEYFDSKLNRSGYIILSNIQTASDVFPCFDSLNLRATFRIEILHEKHLTAISNWPLKSKNIYSKKLLVSIFEETSEMSPSMIAVYATDFECQDFQENEVAIAVCCTTAHVQQSTYATDLTAQFLNYFEEYFNQKCSLRKVHLLGVPHYNDESHTRGVITVNEYRLLLDSSWTLTSDEIRIVSLISQAIFESCFGDLIIARTVSENLMKKSIAYYYRIKGLMHFEQISQRRAEPLDPYLYFINKLSNDIDVNSMYTIQYTAVNEETEHFTSIKHLIAKGAFILNAVENEIGEGNFTEIIAQKLYINNVGDYTTQTASPCVFNRDTHSMALNVCRILDAYGDQMSRNHFSFINMTIDGDSIKLSQITFSTTLLPKNETSRVNYEIKSKNETFAYLLPLTSYKSSASKDKQTISTNNIVFTAIQSKFTNRNMLNYNVNRIGLYALNYPTDIWMNLSYHCENTTFAGIITAVEKLSLILDSLLMAQSNILPYEIPLSLMQCLRPDDKMIAWQTSIRHLVFIRRMLDGTKYFTYVNSFMKQLTSIVYKKYGWSKDAGNWDEKMLRYIALDAACESGHRNCVQTAKLKYKTWTKFPVDAELNADLLLIALKYGTTDTDFRYLFHRFKQSKIHDERIALLRVFAAMKNDTNLAIVLQHLLDDNLVSSEEFYELWTCIAANRDHTNFALKYYARHHLNIASKLRLRGNDEFYSRLIAINFCMHFKPIENTDVKIEVSSLSLTGEVINECIRYAAFNEYWKKNFADTVGQWFEKKYWSLYTPQSQALFTLLLH